MSDSDSRARSFDRKAAEYDLFRPGYPPETVQILAELSNLGPSSQVLEVGCGTGKATVPVAKLGCQLHCVDPGPSLVSIARRACAPYSNVRFTVATFEEATLPAGFYDLVFSAQAFHWTARETRWQKCHRLLVPSGSAALLYNFSVLPQTDVEKELVEIVREGSDGGMTAHDHEESVAAWTEELRCTGLFDRVTLRRHGRRHTMRNSTSASWGRIPTSRNCRRKPGKPSRTSCVLRSQRMEDVRSVSMRRCCSMGGSLSRGSRG